MESSLFAYLFMQYLQSLLLQKLSTSQFKCIHGTEVIWSNEKIYLISQLSWYPTALHLWC